MVKIVDFKTYQTEDGKDFCTLIVQGGVEAVKSQETERTYLTARTARVACTFNEITCKSLIGTDLNGEIQKVEVEPYEYTIKETGEVITLSHRYEYIDEQERIVKENVLKEEEVF
ncbi:hypothetical protein [Winogradskyella sediminis]|uniref:Uncharacterized protein n=1 Tax=Winogradskyella sediminis TaxID=1382466 RepID=A0A1H1SME7_9FLAO|nr:hypothetical protein [Winogradskyella sediminis]SDS49003.1 hypothetical protein SAMN04489797_1711 [Winogradskyella sediminis]